MGGTCAGHAVAHLSLWIRKPSSKYIPPLFLSRACGRSARAAPVPGRGAPQAVLLSGQQVHKQIKPHQPQIWHL